MVCPFFFLVSLSSQNDVNDIPDLTFSMDADEEKHILYEKNQVISCTCFNFCFVLLLLPFFFFYFCVLACSCAYLQHIHVFHYIQELSITNIFCFIHPLFPLHSLYWFFLNSVFMKVNFLSHLKFSGTCVGKGYGL